MTCAKLLLIVTNADARRRLLATWNSFVIRQPGGSAADGPASGPADGPVAFTRLRVREGLDLAVFIVDGGWRREYVCQVLAEEVDGYCLLLGDTPADVSAGVGLRHLLAGTRPGLLAGTAEGSQELLRDVMELAPDVRVPIVDCDSRQSVMSAMCVLLEHLAAVPAA